jgi:CheY-like chemotaxis protein
MTIAAHTHARPEPLGSGLSVLIVDGVELTRRMLSSRLARHGFAISEAGDGAEAARLLAGEPALDAIVLSAPLADTGPAAFAAWLALRPATAGIRLLVLADRDGWAAAADAYRQGAALVLEKPVDLDLIAHKLGSISRQAAAGG